MAAKGVVRSLSCFRSFVPVIRSAQRKERLLLSFNRTRYEGESWQRVKFRRLSSNPEPVSDDVTEVKSRADGLQLSDSCVKQLKTVLGDSTDSFLRVLVEGGGCAGFQYKFELDSALAEDDRVFEKDGVKLVADEASLEYIKGSTIDYHKEMIRSSFQVINNPKADTGCSCGASFSLKL